MIRRIITNCLTLRLVALSVTFLRPYSGSNAGLHP